MWLKLCLLLIYVALLFLLSRMLEAISWCDSGHSGVLSRQLLDPVLLSVAKLKALLEHRGVSYDGVVEKQELTALVETSGPVTAEELKASAEDDISMKETNFTCGAHFVEEVEDGKDSVWLVQVVSHEDQFKLRANMRWNSIQMNASRFGVRMGSLDCSLDVRYCKTKGWKLPVLLLALPSLYEKKANVIMYNFSGLARESAVLHWMRNKLDARVVRIKDPAFFQKKWKNFATSQLDPEIRAVLFSHSSTAPLFYSALSVKFSGRVKFGLVNTESDPDILTRNIVKGDGIMQLPSYVIYTAERNYTFGSYPGEHYSFASMEMFLKFLYPCLNDIFILSFFITNVMSWLEFFTVNCGVFKRVRKFVWCVFKYNIVVIMLWLPTIAIFQMPYLDHAPLILLKAHRIFTITGLGSILRGDFLFYLYHPIYIYLTFFLYLGFVTLLCKKYRQVEEEDENWFNFHHMQTLTHLHPNNIIEPMRVSGNGFLGGLAIFGYRVSQHSLWLQSSIPEDYVQRLPTWKYTPISVAARASENVAKVASAMDSLNKESNSCEFCLHQAACSSKPLRSLSVSPDQAQYSWEDSENNPDSLGKNQDVLSSKHSTLPSPPQSKSSTVPTASTPKDNQCVGKNDACEPSSSTSFETVSCDSEGSNKMAALPSCTCQPPSGKSSTQENPVNLGEQNSEVFSNMDSSTSTQSCICYCDPPPQKSTKLSGFPSGFLESYQCVICLEDYAFQTSLCGLPCGHVFHETCIITWLNRDKHFCPVCRWPSYKIPPASRFFRMDVP